MIFVRVSEPVVHLELILRGRGKRGIHLRELRTQLRRVMRSHDEVNALIARASEEGVMVFDRRGRYVLPGMEPETYPPFTQAPQEAKPHIGTRSTYATCVEYGGGAR